MEIKAESPASGHLGTDDLFCRATGTRMCESSVRLSPLTCSVFHRGHSIDKKTVSALKYIG